MKLVRFLSSVPLFLVGALLALYGLVALLYTGEGGHPGPTYVTLSGRHFDAHRVGAVSLLVALAMIVAGVAVVRRRLFHS
jgi:hypothetical protein